MKCLMKPKQKFCFSITWFTLLLSKSVFSKLECLLIMTNFILFSVNQNICVTMTMLHSIISCLSATVRKRGFHGSWNYSCTCNVQQPVWLVLTFACLQSMFTTRGYLQAAGFLSIWVIPQMMLCICVCTSWYTLQNQCL